MTYAAALSGVFCASPGGPLQWRMVAGCRTIRLGLGNGREEPLQFPLLELVQAQLLRLLREGRHVGDVPDEMHLVVLWCFVCAQCVRTCETAGRQEGGGAFRWNMHKCKSERVREL
jgi:hypothetical protein